MAPIKDPVFSMKHRLIGLATGAARLETALPFARRFGRLASDLERLNGDAVAMTAATFDTARSRFSAAMTKVRDDRMASPGYQKILDAGQVDEIRIPRGILDTLNVAERSRNAGHWTSDLPAMVSVDPHPLDVGHLKGGLRGVVYNAAVQAATDGKNFSLAIQNESGPDSTLTRLESVLGLYGVVANGDSHFLTLVRTGNESCRFSLLLGTGDEETVDRTVTRAANGLWLGILGSSMGESWFGDLVPLGRGLLVSSLTVYLYPDVIPTPPASDSSSSTVFSFQQKGTRVAARFDWNALHSYMSGREICSEVDWRQSALRALSLELYIRARQLPEKGPELQEFILRLYDHELPWLAQFAAEYTVDALGGWAIANRGYPEVDPSTPEV